MKIVSWLLGVALIVVSGMAIHLSREVEAGRQQVADLKAQLQERDSRIAALKVLPVTPPAIAVAANAPQGATSAAGPSPPPPPAPPATAAAVQDLLATLRAQSSSPEATARRRVTARTLIEGANPDISEALGLTGDEADKLLDLLVTHQERSSDVFRSTLEGNGAMTVAERSAALQAQQQANDTELQALLGSKYDQWKDYNETRQAWQQRRDLKAVLDAGGIPMTDAQSKALITALSAEQRAIARQTREALSQGRSTSEIMERYSPERRQRLLDTAAPNLNPQQLEGYRGMLERAAAQERSTRATLQAAQERAEAAGAATAPR